MVLSKVSSWSNTNSSAPMDNGFFMTSRAKVVPEEITVTIASCPSLMRRAASTAFSSKPFTTGGMLGRRDNFLGVAVNPKGGHRHFGVQDLFGQDSYSYRHAETPGEIRRNRRKT